MKLPPIPPVPHLNLPHQLVIPVEALTTVFALTNLAIGFLYLLYGLKIFRVMTTITAVLWGAALGVMFGYLIESTIVAMVFCATALGMATWFWTRWMIALPFGAGAAALAWSMAKLNGGSPLTAFFIALAACAGIGGPVVIFYRTFVMGLTCIQGAVLVVFGTAIGIQLIRHQPLGVLQEDLNNGGHLLLAGVCLLILAVPAFYFQRLRYGTSGEEGEGFGESAATKEIPKKKAA
jgi:hypothetical protein